MGLRGPTAQKNITAAPRLTDLSPPKWLGVLASEHWNKHAKYMSDNLILTQQTAEGFALVCDLYERIRTGATHAERRDSLRQYAQIAPRYRLLPVEKVGAPQDRFEDKKPFNFEEDFSTK